ncbi:acyl-CoA N-acyltransferase [Annulohypoxylon truncatum]|uniref:acyl-CoA N-acyltransferase n=1 Tax=Annulohypoxylon truncatum TaxID=327061 RepID=UPI002007CE35|nr:acyl-CoA N-acyltransferase [Annulohypoxylon truncatum]KAI1210485.1 acyl-CoA N-acyltransferase [Annulohypoxylon truncatum]
MGTPFISLLEPTRLDGYDANKPYTSQPAHIPKLFLDAMEVRETVFVREQKVPLSYEHDADDARSCHWVVYASVNRTTAPEERDPRTGDVVRPRRSETRSTPIGTLRVVPFPHPPHPPPGARYVGNVLQEEDEDDGSSSRSAPPGSSRPRVRAMSIVDTERQASALPFGVDRPTTYHDGKEPYVKVGRVAVIPMFRGHHIASQLWRAAKAWLEQHPTFFDPSVTEMGMDQLKAGGAEDIPKWNGLVCCHAQESVVKIYEKWGFKVDEGMGKWYEEGIPHVGMFQRLNIKHENPKV